MKTLYTPLVALVAGVISAVCFVVGLSHSLWGVFLVLCSPLPIYIAGLGWGSLSAGLAGVFAVMGVMACGDPLLASIFSVVFMMPAFLLSHLAVQPVGGTEAEPVRMRVSGLVQALLIIGLVLVAITSLALASTQAGLVGTIRSNLSLLAETFFGARSSHGPDAVNDVADLVNFWDSLVLGLILAVVMTVHATMGALAQGLVRSGGSPIRNAPPFWQFRLPAWPGILAVVLAAVVMGLDTVSGDRTGTTAFVIYLFTGFVLVLCVGFLLQGLAVLHALTRGMGAQPFILAGTYMVVLVFQPFGAMAFAAVGFAERWANFRERFGVDADTAMED